MYLLAHTCDWNHGRQCELNEETQNSDNHSDIKKLDEDAPQGSCEETIPDFHLNGYDAREDGHGYLATNELETVNDKESKSTFDIKKMNLNIENTDSTSGILWDVFRRQDVPKLIAYLQKYSGELGQPESSNYVVSFLSFSLSSIS